MPLTPHLLNMLFISYQSLPPSVSTYTDRLDFEFVVYFTSFQSLWQDPFK